MNRILFLSLFTAVVADVCPAQEVVGNPATPVYTYSVVNSYPHDPSAYTQGLAFYKGVLYESTGLQGKSTVRRVDVSTGKVLQTEDLSEKMFGEGLTAWKDTLVQLTWQDHTGIVYDPVNLKQKRTFPYQTEGWGITHDGKSLIMSDGTEFLYFLDPVSFEETKRVMVRDHGEPISRLNELEFIRGEIWANIYQTDRIARIDPKTGEVTAYVDLKGLLPAADRSSPVDVLNGIAFDVAHNRIFVTGKLWPKLFEIRVIPPLLPDKK